MHPNSLKLCQSFVDRFLIPMGKPLSILEVGSMKVGGGETLRGMFSRPGWSYVGMDATKGRNVDVVSEDPYSYPFKGGEFDVVVTVNTMEHVEDLHRFAKEVARVSRGLVYADAPGRWKIHRYPIDCWRILPDGMEFLFGKVAGMEIVETGVEAANTWCVARKK